MSSKDNTTTRFGVDITDLKKQFQDAKKSIAIINSEFKNATASMDNWSTSADGLSAKIKQLNSLEQQEAKKLEVLREEYRRVVEAQGENSAGAKELTIQINNQEATLKKVQKDLRNYTQQLEDLEDSTYGVAENIDEISNANEDLGDSTEKAKNGFSVLKGAVANFVGNALSNLVSKIGEAISGLWNLSDETKEFRDQMNKLSSSAKDGGYSIDYANQTFKKFYQILGDDVASTTTTSNLMATGMSMNNLNRVTKAMIGVWSKYGDSIPLDGLAESINETAKVGQITGNLADALNWAGINEDDFNIRLSECSDEQSRQTLIADALSNTYSGLADTYMETNASIMDANAVQLEYTQNLAELGAIIEPIQTELKRGFNEILSAFVKMLKGMDFNKITNGIKSIFDYIIGIDWNNIGKQVEKGIGGIKTIFSWIIDNQTIILSALTSLLSGLVAMNVSNIVMNLTKAFQSLKLVITQSAIAQKLLNSVMFKNPISLVIGAIAGLVAGFIVLWKRSEKFRNFWINLWEKIKEVVPPVWEKIKSVMISAWNTIKTTWDKVQPYFNTIFIKVKETVSTVSSSFIELFQNAWNKIKEVWNNAQPYFKIVWDNIISPLVEIGKSMFNAFHEAWLLICTVWDLASPYFNAILEYIKKIFSTIAIWFYNKFLEIYQALKIVWDIIYKFLQFAWLTIEPFINTIRTYIIGAFSTAWEVIKGVWFTATSFFKTIWDTIAGIFSVVRNVLTGNWSDAWESIKGIVSTWKDFFSGVWDNIKNIFSAVKDWFKNTFQSAWDSIKEVFSNWSDFFGSLWDEIKNKFVAIGVTIADAISGAVRSGINGVINDIEATINNGINIINGAISLINAIPNVDLGYINTLNLPRLAKGGIVSSPTLAQIGEHGQEAVIPLENNLKWLKVLAKELANEITNTSKLSNSTQSSSNNTTLNFYQTNTSPKSLSRLEVYRQTKNLLNFTKAVI